MGAHLRSSISLTETSTTRCKYTVQLQVAQFFDTSMNTIRVIWDDRRCGFLESTKAQNLLDQGTGFVFVNTCMYTVADFPV